MGQLFFLCSRALVQRTQKLHAASSGRSSAARKCHIFRERERERAKRPPNKGFLIRCKRRRGKGGGDRTPSFSSPPPESKSAPQGRHERIHHPVMFLSFFPLQPEIRSFLHRGERGEKVAIIPSFSSSVRPPATPVQLCSLRRPLISAYTRRKKLPSLNVNCRLNFRVVRMTSWGCCCRFGQLL